MATKSGNKSKQYLQAKKQQKKGSTVKRSSAKRGSKKQREKRILAGVLSVIALLTVIIGILFAHLIGGSVFKEKLPNGSLAENEEWTDIEIMTPEDMKDGRTQKENVYTFVCCGIDIDEYRADTILLVTLDMNTKTANVMHILRDTYVSANNKDYKINSFYARKKSDGIRQIIYNKLGIYPNYYITLNFEAFRNIVDIIGGVEVDVPFDMKYSDPTQDLYIDLKAGKQLLDGDKAEQFVRYRKGSGGDGSDESRQKRQEEFMLAFMKKASTTSSGKIVSVVSEIIEHMFTNLSVAELTQFAHDGIELGVENVNFYTLPGEYEYVNDYWYYVGHERKTIEMLNEYFNPYEEKLTSKWVNFDEPVEKEDPDDSDSDSEESGSEESDFRPDSENGSDGSEADEKSSSSQQQEDSSEPSSSSADE